MKYTASRCWYLQPYLMFPPRPTPRTKKKPCDTILPKRKSYTRVLAARNPLEVGLAPCGQHPSLVPAMSPAEASSNGCCQRYKHLEVLMPEACSAIIRIVGSSIAIHVDKGSNSTHDHSLSLSSVNRLVLSQHSVSTSYNTNSCIVQNGPCS